jgi:hypothetical protein
MWRVGRGGSRQNDGESDGRVEGRGSDGVAGTMVGRGSTSGREPAGE